jgi:rhodanese-related sulfurtransferase
MKKALDNPALGIKVVDVREPDEYEIAKVAGVPLLPLSQLTNVSRSWTRTSNIICIAKPACAR